MRTRTKDPEVSACRLLVRALTPLDVPQQQRVLRWAIERFSVHGSKRETPARGSAQPHAPQVHGAVDANTCTAAHAAGAPGHATVDSAARVHGR